MNKDIRKLIAFLIFIFLIGCTNRQNEMLDWSSKIPIGTDPITVMKSQPDFLEIDWENPDTLGNGYTRYMVVEIKGHYDLFKMAYFVEFENNGFRGLFAFK
jgi:hypothetical protein